MLPFQVAKLKQLPQHVDDVWQGGIVRLPMMALDDDGDRFEPEVALWISRRTGKAGPSPLDHVPGDTPLETALNSLVAFANDREAAGFRPGRVEVGDAVLAKALSDVLSEVGIRVEYRDELVELQGLLDEMGAAFSQGAMIPGPLDDTGVTLDRLRAFAAAAKVFFKAAPWRWLGGEDLVEVESPAADAGLRFAVVLGAAGQEYGLGFYRSTDHYWKTYECEHPGDLLDAGPLWSLIFHALDDLPMGDAEAWSQERLPICRERLFPVLIQQKRDGVERADAATLTYVEGLM